MRNIAVAFSDLFSHMKVAWMHAQLVPIMSMCKNIK